MDYPAVATSDSNRLPELTYVLTSLQLAFSSIKRVVNQLFGHLKKIHTLIVEPKPFQISVPYHRHIIIEPRMLVTERQHEIDLRFTVNF